MELKDIKKVHLIGDQGISMRGIRQVLEVRGLEVSGCDISTTGHGAKHITKDFDLVLYSSAITPQSAGYKELVAAKRQGIMTQKRAWLLGRLMQEKNKIGIAIAGMHGKSTTTAMVGKILEQAGEDPLVLLGAEVPGWDSPVRLGRGKYVVVEADEYDRSFHLLIPKIAAILNIEPEHLDYYTRGLPEIIRAFREFVKLVPSNGFIVVNQDDKNAAAAVKSARARVKYVTVQKPWPGLRLKVWGQHNLFDATMAARVAHELGVDSKIVQKTLNNFSGVKRRMEHLGSVSGVDIYDDYAHHPTEIKATLQAAREHFGKRKIIVVFQPHQAARLKALFDDFSKSFANADWVIVAPIFRVAGRDDSTQISSKDLVEAITQTKALALAKRAIAPWLSGKTKPGDVVITMGAGSIFEVGQQWIQQTNSKND